MSALVFDVDGAGHAVDDQWRDFELARPASASAFAYWTRGGARGRLHLAGPLRHLPRRRPRASGPPSISPPVSPCTRRPASSSTRPRPTGRASFECRTRRVMASYSFLGYLVGKPTEVGPWIKQALSVEEFALSLGSLCMQLPAWQPKMMLLAPPPPKVVRLDTRQRSGGDALAFAVRAVENAERGAAQRRTVRARGLAFRARGSRRAIGGGSARGAARRRRQGGPASGRGASGRSCPPCDRRVPHDHV